ncbi:MAG: acetyl-CoA C-acetyltransferase, partial [Deltaproteobacteria bacterium]|nr:acetyl-CoA C-acetyltransferase [Deltaproteobacteria bacterium]
MSRRVVIASAARTPVGSFNGTLSNVPAPSLGAVAITEAMMRATVEPERVEQVIMGCVLTAGVGQAPARQAALGAGLPTSVCTTTVGKVCGSGLKAVTLAADTITAGHADIIVAGGMENMSLAPHLLEKSRSGYKMGKIELADSMIKDGLWDVYNQFHMGNAAELCARKYQISRQDQDRYAEMSYRRALKAQKEGYFEEEIVPVSV